LWRWFANVSNCSDSASPLRDAPGNRWLCAKQRSYGLLAPGSGLRVAVQKCDLSFVRMQPYEPDWRGLRRRRPALRIRCCSCTATLHRTADQDSINALELIDDIILARISARMRITTEPSTQLSPRVNSRFERPARNSNVHLKGYVYDEELTLASDANGAAAAP
jgi:hypothetical protein